MSETAPAAAKPLYLIQWTKQTSMLGEQVTITTNMPGDSTQEEIAAELAKLGGTLDERMRLLNRHVIKQTGKNLGEMGMDPAEMGFDPASIYEQGEDKAS